MFQRCLICTDFSDGLDRLISFIPHFAKGGLKRIIFLHSVPIWQEGTVPRVDEKKISAAKERLSSTLQSVPEAVEVKVEIPSGRPVEHILKVAEVEKIDVILLGTPIRSSLQESIFGSTTTELAKLTSIPLMILRPQLISTYTSEELALRTEHLWRYLLIPYNDSKAAHYLIERLTEYAQTRPENSLEQCLLLWVIDDGRQKELLTPHRRQEAQEKLAFVKTQLEALGLAVKVEVRQGNPLLEILKAAHQSDISAIAIADYRTNWLEWTVPSLARDVLHRSWFPVLFFSPKSC